MSSFWKRHDAHRRWNLLKNRAAWTRRSPLRARTFRVGRNRDCCLRARWRATRTFCCWMTPRARSITRRTRSCVKKFACIVRTRQRSSLRRGYRLSAMLTRSLSWTGGMWRQSAHMRVCSVTIRSIRKSMHHRRKELIFNGTVCGI